MSEVTVDDTSQQPEPTAEQAGRSRRDLVMVALTGVQRFIEESRSTSDLRAGSRIIADLATEAARVFEEATAELVFPTSTAGQVGVPNRVVALAPQEQGTVLARRAARRVEEQWRAWVRTHLGRDAATPGMPGVVWVAVPPAEGGYPQQWRQAQQRLAARRGVRDFPAQQALAADLCSLSPRWPAVEPPRKNMRPFERDRLGAANWVKRERGRRGDGIASTSGFASAPFRAKVLEHMAHPKVAAAVADLRDAVAAAKLGTWERPVPGLPKPRGKGAQVGAARWLWRYGGRWVYRDTWEAEGLAREVGRRSGDADFAGFRDTVGLGRMAAATLQKVMAEEFAVAEPAAHLALLAQDLDGMGRHLSRSALLSPEAHADLSRALGRVARSQADLLRSPEILGAEVYAGGDDLLAFVPASTALTAARGCEGAISAVSAELPTASSAVLFFHHKYPLRLALAEVRACLERAKAVPGKHALAAGYLRRAGAREVCVQPWVPNRLAPGLSAGDYLADFTPGADADAPRLSPGLLRDVERDAAALAELDQDTFEAELRRLVHRHTSGGDERTRREFAVLAGRRLRTLSAPDNLPADDSHRSLIAAARVAVFLRQECR
ncbi:Cas10/Cmr2 second palm domain-containing protein [Salinactinospora qingdaonensis]|uniref:Type III-B CRISPR-associated protein Cas10/Cmr2 n=1 Tax=Salinactinospora qingdaonensis TaxID=702744 RepID=A0ABP7FBQ5_9ACTN